MQVLQSRREKGREVCCGCWRCGKRRRGIRWERKLGSLLIVLYQRRVEEKEWKTVNLMDLRLLIRGKAIDVPRQPNPRRLLLQSIVQRR